MQNNNNNNETLSYPNSICKRFMINALMMIKIIILLILKVSIKVIIIIMIKISINKFIDS